MADDKTTIRELIDAVKAFETQRDWRRFHSPKNLSMGIAIETGELMEHFQWLGAEESKRAGDDPGTLAAVREEMADVLCYLLNLADVMGVDLSDAFYEKMKKNEKKYPTDRFYGRYK
jgi:dCTP diphosphatase